MEDKMKRTFRAVGVVAALALAACSETTAPGLGNNVGGSLGGVTGGNVSPQEAQAVLSVVDASGWAAQDFGAVGATTEFQNDGEAWATSVLGPAATVAVPEFWG